MEGDFPCSLLAEAAEERNVVAKHGIVGAGMLHGGIDLVFDAGNGLEQELAEIAERFGGLVGDAFLGERGEDFAEDVVYVGDGVEFAGKGSEFGGELFGFKALLFFASVVDAERGMALLAKHAAGTAVGGLAETPVAAGIVGVWIHGNLKKEELLTLRGRAGTGTERNSGNFRFWITAKECSLPGRRTLPANTTATSINLSS